METLKAKRTTKYGIQLEDETFRNTTEPVKNFLTGKLPAEIEVLEMSGKTISKVKVLGFHSDNSVPAERYERTEKTDTIERMSALNRRINARICALNNATELVKTDPEAKKDEKAVLIYAAEFLKFLEEQGE